ncbi:septum site-determining protein MinC [Gracilibacillus ureilyticus]|uniref:Probable septum site-determining protein MinC n=1 Tax=Gracilibacillus ureilyticus TaxID=531814 RepID=A0A1H9RR98_9BACI|nr:septum site-determining protein MinC [Gracilibacillus ureilyticus]
MVTNRCITIKGTRDGLTLFMDDTCAFNDLLKELESVLSMNYIAENEQPIRIRVELGNRYITGEQEEKLKEMFANQQNFTVDQIVSNVILKQTALEWKDDTAIKLHNKIIRSGQELNIVGDLLLIGDVNPGGKVVATGNIYILGHLRGIAHAGSDGNKSSIIAASYMSPTQLRIANVMSRSPDEGDGGMMECGFVDRDSEQIIMDRISTLARTRSDLSVFERRIMNG